MALTLNLRQEIDAPLERVFAVMTDLERANEWMPNFVGIEPLTPGKLAVGSRWRETRKCSARRRLRSSKSGADHEPVARTLHRRSREFEVRQYR